MAVQSAFQALVSLDQHCRRIDQASSESAASLPTESTVCFILSGNYLTAPFGELLELLEVPQWTRLPRVQSWVCGVANLRGKLLPIIDLADFLGGALQSAPRRQRVLVVDKHGVFVGLLVDEVVGMHHFPQDAYVADVQLEGAVTEYVEGSYRDGDRLWGQFSPSKLVRSAKFLNVTA